ncbi:MAG: hypothetical protein AAF711_10300, partial [Planctomycetota bacterium]
MPVYFITVHTYRSWREDNPWGYIQRGKPGVQRPNARLAEYRQQSATGPRVELTEPQIVSVLKSLHEVCLNLEVTPYAASCTPTHWHLLVGWIETDELKVATEAADQSRSIATRLKRVVGSKLSAEVGQTGLRWFSHGWHIERIDEQKHF